MIGTDSLILKKYNKKGILIEENIFSNKKHVVTRLHSYFKDIHTIIPYSVASGKKEGYTYEYKILSKTDSVLISKAFFLNDKIDGLVLNFYENGSRKCECYKKMGKWDGISKQYFENGNLKSEISYRNDKTDGKAIFYNTDGTIRVEEFSIDGRFEGDQIHYFYDSRKQLIKKDIYVYKKGKLINQRSFQ